MEKITIKSPFVHCEYCGYPFDRGQRALAFDRDEGPIVCGSNCADQLIAFDDQQRRAKYPPGGQTLSCFIN